jgi:hypothetical protein
MAVALRAAHACRAGLEQALGRWVGIIVSAQVCEFWDVYP